MGDYPGSSRQIQCNHEGRDRRETRISHSEREETRTETEIREERSCYTSGSEDGGKGSIKECRQTVEAWKVKETDSHLQPPEGT